MYTIRPISNAEAAAYAGMTYPAHRSLLFAAEATRLALGAVLLDRPVALLLAQFHEPSRTAAIHSIYVAPEYRGQGIATALLAHAEQRLREQGCIKAVIRYLTGKPSTHALERVLAKRDWSPPHMRLLILRTSADRITQAPWWQIDTLPPSFSITPWASLTDLERESLIQPAEAVAWAPRELAPAQWQSGYEPHSSLVLRYENQIVGWMLNHALSPHTIRFSSGWVRKDLQRARRSLPFVALLVESIKRAIQAGYTEGSWYVSPHQQAMLAFARRWMKPYTTAYQEMRQAEKYLA